MTIGKRRRGWQRMRWLNSITNTMDMGLGELRELVMDREAWRAVVHGVAQSRTQLSNWTELNDNNVPRFFKLRLPWKILSLMSHKVVSSSLRPHGLQHARLRCPSLSPIVCSNWCPLSQQCHPSSVAPSLHTFNLSQHQGLFQWVGSLHQVTKVWELQLQHQSFQWIFWVDFL